MQFSAVLSLEGRKIKAQHKYEPETFPGLLGGPDLGTGPGSVPGFGIGGSPCRPSGVVAYIGTPVIPGGGVDGAPGISQP